MLVDNLSILWTIIFFCIPTFIFLLIFSFAWNKAIWVNFWHNWFTDFSSSNLIIDKLDNFNLLMSSSTAANKAIIVCDESKEPCCRICSAFILEDSKFFLATNKFSSASLNLFSASWRLFNISALRELMISANQSKNTKISLIKKVPAS